MQIFKIAAEGGERLLSLPESGMGYQVITNYQKHYVVFNATVGVLLSELLEGAFSDDDYLYISGRPSRRIRSVEAKVLTIGEDVRITYSDLYSEGVKSKTYLPFNKSATSPRPGVFYPDRPQSYYRFSAFNNDKRIGRLGFRPGTYATTYNDIREVPSGLAAVGRYALPNPAAAKFVFQIVTRDNPDRVGTVTPNYSQPGGGVEVYFKNSARNDPQAGFRISAG